MQNHYSGKWVEFFEAVLHEIFAMYRTIGQHDTVKLVVVDLDDTLWRGVAAEGTLGILEGWPMGFMEALLLLKKRGILLAIISKNDEGFILSNWDNIVQGQIALSDFATCKINFRSKVENLTDILKTFNLRPHNVVMVDDNPVERAAVRAQLPAVRVLGKNLYYLKRVLLWSAETQQRVITEESTRKTEMMQAQLQRESVRGAVSHEEFLRTLALRVSLSLVHGTTDLQMSRALELLNKTKQFNTTGRRYYMEECRPPTVRFESRRSVHAIRPHRRGLGAPELHRSPGGELSRARSRYRRRVPRLPREPSGRRKSRCHAGSVAADRREHGLPTPLQPQRFHAEPGRSISMVAVSGGAHAQSAPCCP
jgi:FkbH-like protein